MSTLVYGDWRDDNQRRKYPFADDALLTNGTLVIPNSLFIDGRLYPIGGDETLYLNRITREEDVIEFGVRSGDEELATGSYSVTDVPENGEIAFHDEYGRPAGMLLATDTSLRAFSGLNAGEYTFTQPQARFAAAVVAPQPEVGVRGFLLADGSVVTADVIVVGEDGAVVRKDEDGTLRIDFIGDPFALRKLCKDEEPNDEDVAALTPYCPIKTINGISPDALGDFKLLVGSTESLSPILRITSIAQADDDVRKHLKGESALKFASLLIQVLGQRKFRGV
jgi:hypothetical protein